MNLVDMARKKEFYLLDTYSDATQYGGLSETLLTHHPEEGFVRLNARFIREKQGLVMPTNTMFSGFQNNYLLKREYELFNGIRVTMKPPMYPCKIGLHLKVNIGNEFELFSVSQIKQHHIIIITFPTGAYNGHQQSVT